MLEFSSLTGFTRGILYKLLFESYSELLKYKADFAGQYEASWKKEDDEAFDNPDTIGKCIRISLLDEIPVGFFSWDPRGIPKAGIIGQNCIVPSHRGKGYGKQQILEIIRIFRKASTPIIEVTTENHPFFYPARKTYLSCGFKESGRSFKEVFGRVEIIHFRFKGEN